MKDTKAISVSIASAFQPLAALLLCGAALPVLAQEDAGEAVPAAEPEATEEATGEAIEFAADSIDYDPTSEVVRASGNVVVARGEYRVRADEVTYDRATGTVTARGNVEGIDLQGNELYAGEVVLQDDLRDGAIDGFLLVLADGGRLAASEGLRTEERIVVERGVYSPCRVIDGNGCPQEPLWQIKADQVTYAPEEERIRYRNPRFEILGIPVLALPALSHADSPEARADGILIPDFRIDNDTGISITQPYFFALDRQSDLTVAPTLYTEVAPSLSAEYRQVLAAGAFQIGGIATLSSVERFEAGERISSSAEKFRGYLYGNGAFQHSEEWRSEFAVRATTDDSFLRRYEISRDTSLRNFARTQKHTASSFFSVGGWAFQGLALDDDQGLIPLALPIVDYTYRPGMVAGGRVSLDASSATVMRADGMDSFRLTAGGGWRRDGYTRWGQQITLQGLVRGDLYRTWDADLAELEIYEGQEGFEGRLIPAAAIDVRWPLAGPAFGGTQLVTPRVQLSASPRGLNDDIPNEDSRSVDLESTNLFDLSRFPGHDRWEGGSRITYGVEYRLQRPRWLVEAEIGQSYSLDDSPSIVPSGTGLAENFSDFVGRNSLRIGSRFDLVHRYRVDKDNLKVRRNEIDLTYGGRRDYVTLGYLKLDRDIGFEDLADREEVRAGGRVALTRYWSVFGSVILDLTDSSEDPISLADGFEPVRHRVGAGYEDECFEFSVTWRRDYIETLELQRGNTFSFSVSLKNIGR